MVWLVAKGHSPSQTAPAPDTACDGSSGTKLPRTSPCASSSANQVASLTSVLRPGTFLTCAAFASTRIVLAVTVTFQVEAMQGQFFMSPDT
jgi:hypothetical protein